MRAEYGKRDAEAEARGQRPEARTVEGEREDSKSGNIVTLLAKSGELGRIKSVDLSAFSADILYISF